jgi:hypothetical protein
MTDTVTLILKSEVVRDRLRRLKSNSRAQNLASYIDILRDSARRTGTLEVSMIQGALIEAEPILADTRD